MLTAKVTKDVPIPHEPDEWMRFRMLSAASLDKAREARLAKVFVMARQMGPEMRAEIDRARADGANASTTSAVPADSLNDFDVPSLLQAGIIAWSYDATISPHTIEDLDEVTSKWAANEIYALTHSTEAERKNGSSPSIAPSMETGRRRGNG